MEALQLPSRMLSVFFFLDSMMQKMESQKKKKQKQPHA